jgi:hypothetical protein
VRLLAHLLHLDSSRCSIAMTAIASAAFAASCDKRAESI